MPFSANVIRVRIASPGDVVNERRLCRTVIDDWNSMHAEQGVVLIPLGWDTDATPEMGDRPQGVLNRQLVEQADVLIGLFWTRLGTPTGEAESGTVEEIEECIKAGKPVRLYFSNTPVVPGSIDLGQFERLRDARADFETRGYVGSFASEHELYRLLMADLTRTVRDHFGLSLVEPDESPNRRVFDRGHRARQDSRSDRTRARGTWVQ